MVKRPALKCAAWPALLTTLVLLAVGAASATAATVNLEIESQGATIFNGPVTTTGGAVPTGADCSAIGTTTVNQTGANAITALVAWSALSGATFNTGMSGAFVCRIGGDTGNASVYWMMKINNKTKEGSTYFAGSTPLKDGDSVLWYFTDDYAKKTLSLNIPASAQAGSSITGSVSAYDGADDTKSAASGVTVTGPAASATSAADGSFSLSFPTAGKYLVTATKDGAIRASANVTVTDAPVVIPPTLKQLNVAKRAAARAACIRAVPSRKGSAYKLCIRRANALGHTVSNKQRRIDARAKCRKDRPSRRGAAYVACIRKANLIGR